MGMTLLGISLFCSISVSLFITTLSHSFFFTFFLIFLLPYHYVLQRGRRGGGAPARRPAAPSRPQSRPASSSARTPAPQQSSVAAPAKSGGGMLSGIGSTIAQGMAFGTGSAIAHQAVGAVMGGGGSSRNHEAPQEQQQQAPMPAQGQGMMNQQDSMMGACSNDKSMFYDCLNHNKGDQQSCTFLYEQLQQCQQNSSQSSSQMQF
jgi:hypothetical protein